MSKIHEQDILVHPLETHKRRQDFLFLSLKLCHNHLCIYILDFGSDVMVIILQITLCAPNILKPTLTDMEKSICL
jgi:hypothetical protein